nr:hypothetical protein [Tanacetum cinerariifolium]
MQEFWATVSVNHTSLRFKMNNKSYTLNLKIFRDVLQICPKLPSQKFEDPSFEEEILFFIRDLGHTGEIKGMYHKKNVDYVYLLWEDLVYQSILRRNKMFWHTARDDPMFNMIRVISRHQDIQIYSVILPDVLTNQELLYSKAYNEYYAVVSGAEPPKAKTKHKKKPDELVTPSKSKSSPAAKGTRLKTPAKVTQSGKKRQSVSVLKAKGLDVLSEGSLTEDEQIKLAIKRSKKDFHMSHASGSGDGVDIQSKVPGEQQQKVTGTNEGAGIRPEVPSVPKCNSKSEEESWTFSQNDEDDVEESDMNDDSEETESDNDADDLTHPNLSTYKSDDEEGEKEKAGDDEVSSYHRVYSPPDHELTEEEKEENKKGNDEDMEVEQEQDEKDDLYKDVNINLERSDVEMTNAQANQDTEETHVTLTTVPPVVQQQSSSVSSDMVSKFINPSPDIGINSILNPNIKTHTFVNVPVYVAAETPHSDTTNPQTPIPIIQPLQQKPESITTTTIPTTTLPDIPNFASLLQFDQRVSALETELSKFRQTNQFAKVISLIHGIVDNYLASKIKEAVDVAVQLQANKLREEAQAENQEFLNQVDSTMKTIIKKQVQAQVSKIMPKIKKSDIQKNLYNALVESYNSNKDIFSSYGDVVTVKRGRDDQDKDEDPFAGSNRGSKRMRSGKEAESSKELTHKESKSTKEHDQKVDDLEDQSHQEFNTGNDDENFVREALDVDENWHNLEGKPYPHDLSKPLPLIQNERDHQVIPWDYFIDNDLEYLKGGSSSRKYTTSITKTKAADYSQVKWIEDKVSRIWSPKKINLTRPDTYRLDLKRMTPYPAYLDIQGIIYDEEMNINRLMRTNELHKFNDSTLNHGRTALNDISTGIEMDYLPKQKWSKQDKQRARVMINAIDRKLRDRRLMRNLEKFFGRRAYGGDLRLLERTI